MRSWGSTGCCPAKFTKWQNRDIRNALEYLGQDLTIDIIISTLENKELELKIETKDSKSSEGLHIRERLN